MNPSTYDIVYFPCKVSNMMFHHNYYAATNVSKIKIFIKISFRVKGRF